MTSTGSHFKRWVFSRHSNPWSAWTRWATTPLVLFPVWNRSARQGVVVAAWFALNPILFPPPRDDSAFATRAVLGEERWLKERPVSGALAINCLASAAALIAIDSARRHRRWQMTIATMGTMSALLWYWREMVRFYDTRGTANSRPLPDPPRPAATLADGSTHTVKQSIRRFPRGPDPLDRLVDQDHARQPQRHDVGRVEPSRSSRHRRSCHPSRSAGPSRAAAVAERRIPYVK